MVWWEAAGSVGDGATREVLSAAAGVTAFAVHRQAGRQPATPKQSLAPGEGGAER